MHTFFQRAEPELHQLEETYRQHHLHTDTTQTLVFLSLMVIANLGFVPVDYVLFQQQPTMLALVFGLRGLMTCGSIGFAYVIRRITQPNQYNQLVFAYTLFIVFFQGLSATTRPPSYFGTFIFDILLVLCCYIIIPNALPFRITAALVGTVISLLSLFLTREPAVLYGTSIPIALIGVNIIGFISSTRTYNYRRQEYLAIHEAHNLNQQLTILAETDALTEIFNRRKFIELGSEEFIRFQRYRHTFSLAILDIDFFKLVNDQHGHEAGDQVLKEVVGIIQAEKRSTDLIGRLGGEEFGILLPETPLSAACTVLERIRQQVQSTTIRTTQIGLAVTFSAGVIEIAHDEASFEDAMRRADQLLYRAKRNGRNRIEHEIAARVG